MIDKYSKFERVLHFVNLQFIPGPQAFTGLEQLSLNHS